MRKARPGWGSLPEDVLRDLLQSEKLEIQSEMPVLGVHGRLLASSMLSPNLKSSQFSQ